MSKIFHHGAQAPATPGGAAPGAPSATTAAPTAPQAGMEQGKTTNVDVAEVLTGIAAKAGQRLDWRHSIVDLMKLLDLDSSLTARKELAKELQYGGGTNESAALNNLLPKQGLTKLPGHRGRGA